MNYIKIQVDNYPVNVIKRDEEHRLLSKTNKIIKSPNLLNSIQNTFAWNEGGFSLNFVGLNEKKNKDLFPTTERLSFSGNIIYNLKLESIGNSKSYQKIQKSRNKNKVKELYSEPKIKIAPAFGRTAYTLINKNNNKNKTYSNKLMKNKKIFSKNNMKNILIAKKGAI